MSQSKIQILESGIRLYKKVDGQLVRLSPDAERRHLDWLCHDSPEARIAVSDFVIRCLPQQWTVEAN